MERDESESEGVTGMDPRRLVELIDQLAPALELYARQWTDAPEDVVQDAFVRFWRRNHNIDNRALLYAAVRSAALDLIRRDGRRARRETEVYSGMAQFSDPQFETIDDSQGVLATSIDRLPHEQREVLVMKIWNELTFTEIGSVLGISQNTAASRYRYALGALRKNFTPQ